MKSAYMLSESGGVDEAQRLRDQAVLAMEAELGPLMEGLKAGDRVVDLGCGSGLLCGALAQARPDCDVLGLDADALAVSEAAGRYRAPRLRFAQRPVQDGPLDETQRGDRVLMRLVLMHLPGPAAVLAGLRRWLKPGGTLHIIEGDDRGIETVPVVGGLATVLDAMQRVQRGRGGDRRLGRDVPAMLEAAGWRILGRREITPPPAVAAKALPAVFAPVARQYLEKGAAEGHLKAGEAEAGLRALESLLRAGVTEARVPLYHVWCDTP